ncbi:hypothetical protein HUN08_13175 [Gordonia sp. X0973]|uniref:hypothetical protein n=1 Tax=Gordonia sp. X0973 TaxID=2742602 RepID=UPI000F53A937|nr:hypothetical protein [Gordonia sp. X0973]QKT08028.1 hypothetical protein HUN08_13175 [Gordonia sp. X0973]
MTDKPDETADGNADAAAESAPQAAESAATTAGIPAPPTAPLAGHQPPPPVAAHEPKGSWWRDHVWTTVIGVSLLTGVIGLGAGFALGYLCGDNDSDRGSSHEHHKRWDDRDRDWYGDRHGDRWGPRRGDDGWGQYGGPRGYGDDGSGGYYGPRGDNGTPPWMRTPRLTPGQPTPAPGQPTPAPGAPAPGAPA